MDGRLFQPGGVRENVRGTAEKLRELRDVAEVGKALLLPISLAGRFDLQNGTNFTELVCPFIEGHKAELLKLVVHQIFFHDIHFAHGIHDRRCRGEYDAAAAVELLQVSDL